jgi:hypothetical protein
MGKGMADGSLFLNFLRPVGDHRGMDSALMIILFEEPVRGIRQIGPPIAVALVSNFRPGHDMRKVTRFHRFAITGFFGQVISLALRWVFHMTSTIIYGEEDKGVI